MRASSLSLPLSAPQSWPAVQLPAGKARAFQLVDGLGRHLAEGRTAAVAVV